ncbi:MAG: radical SAM protein [Actinomycetota bacterium]|nr:radical SAM protein [Actinomycetota bacterium]
MVENPLFSKKNFIDKPGLNIPSALIWQFTLACNSRCLHCYANAGKALPAELSNQEALMVAQEVIRAGIPRVIFTGGEPFLRSDFPEVLQLLSENGVSMKIETNGSLIDENLVNFLVNLNLASIEISLDGSGAESHEGLRPGSSWTKAVKAIKLLSEAGIKVQVLFIPTRINCREIEETIGLAYSLAVSEFFVGELLPFGRATKNWTLLSLSPQEQEDLVKLISNNSSRFSPKMKIFFFSFKEELKKLLSQEPKTLFLSADGRGKIKGSLPFYIGDIRKESLFSIYEKIKKEWRNPKLRKEIGKYLKTLKI